MQESNSRQGEPAGAIIGLGLLGSAIAQRLVAAGFRIDGYDIRPEARERAEAYGVAVHPSARETARRARLLILSLMTSEDRRRLLWGEQDAAAALVPGTVILDTTTARPGDIVDDHARLQGIGVRLVDVCVSGSSQAALEGRATALIGDTPENAAGYDSAVATFTKRRFYFHKPGQGNRAKLIVNTVYGLHRLVLAEALGLASKAGFGLATMLDVLRSGDTYSVMMDTKGPKMVSGLYEPAAARLEQHAKDVELILEFAKQIGASVPVSELHYDLLQRALELGAGPLDNAAIFQVYSDKG